MPQLPFGQPEIINKHHARDSQAELQQRHRSASAAPWAERKGAKSGIAAVDFGFGGTVCEQPAGRVKVVGEGEEGGIVVDSVDAAGLGLTSLGESWWSGRFWAYVPTSYPGGICSPLRRIPSLSTSRQGTPDTGGEARIVSVIHADKYEQDVSLGPGRTCVSSGKLLRISLASLA